MPARVGGYINGRSAAQRGAYPVRNPSTGWFNVSPAVPLSPAVPFCTRVSAGLNPAYEPRGDPSCNAPSVRGLGCQAACPSSAPSTGAPSEFHVVVQFHMITVQCSSILVDQLVGPRVPQGHVFYWNLEHIPNPNMDESVPGCNNKKLTGKLPPQHGLSLQNT